MENPEIDEYGNKVWRNEKGELHREDGPAIEELKGYKAWYQNGKRHRIDGPAIEYSDGDKSWYIEGMKYTEEEYYQKLAEMDLPEINEDGDKVWKNEKGITHREKGPAIELASGSKFWYKNGNRHRLDGPAIEYVNGDKEWWIEGEYYTEIQYNEKIAEIKVQNPEIDYYGNKFWRNKKGELHRDDGPAIERANGSKSWYQNGQLHRLDGPAMEIINGDKYWCQNDKYHRLDGPAIECANGDKYWCQNDKYHRLDGPAVECANGRKEWWIDGIKYTDEEEFNKKIEKKEVNTMKEIIKDRVEKAAYRSASRQMVNGISKAIVLAAEKKGMDSFTVAAVGKFFETELGSALIGAMLGVGIPYIPKINKDQRALKLAEEFQVEAISTVTDTLLNEVFTYVLPVMKEVLNTLPSRVEGEAEKEETAEAKNTFNITM
jgi:hypothetical protein